MPAPRSAALLFIQLNIAGWFWLTRQLDASVELGL